MKRFYIIISLALMILSVPAHSRTVVDKFNNIIKTKYKPLHSKLSTLKVSMLMHSMNFYDIEKNKKIPINKINCGGMRFMEDDLPEMKVKVKNLKPEVTSTIKSFNKLIGNISKNTHQGQEVIERSRKSIESINNIYSPLEKHVSSMRSMLVIFNVTQKRRCKAY